MVNINPIVVKKLKEIEGIKQISAEYPDDFAIMPTVTYKENDNSDTGKTQTEVVSNLEYQIDIWDKKSVTDIAAQVNEVFSGMGFRRISSVQLIDPNTNLKHRVMRFRGKYDGILNRICQ